MNRHQKEDIANRINKKIEYFNYLISRVSDNLPLMDRIAKKKMYARAGSQLSATMYLISKGKL